MNKYEISFKKLLEPLYNVLENKSSIKISWYPLPLRDGHWRIKIGLKQFAFSTTVFREWYFSNYHFQENSAKSEKTAKKVEMKARTLLWWRRHWRRFFYMQWDDWREIIPCFAKMLASDRLACFCFASAHFYISSLENEPIFFGKIISRVGTVG